MAGSSQYTCPGMGESCGCSSRLHEVLEKHIGYFLGNWRLQLLFSMEETYLFVWLQGQGKVCACFLHLLPKEIRRWA